MNRIFIIYTTAIVLAASAIYYAVAQDYPGFRERIIKFLEKPGSDSNPENEKSGENVFLPSEKNKETFFNSSEWSEYVTGPEYNQFQDQLQDGSIYSDESVNISASGSVKADFNYGKSFYTKKKYMQYDQDQPKSKIINSGFWPDQTILFHMDGTVGDRITVFIDHDSKRKENRYLMNYRARSDDEVIREINAGEIDIKFNHSRYAVYDNTEAKGLGVDFTVKKGDFTLKAFGSVARGETAVEYFKGNSSPGNTKILDYQYIRGTYYQLEPFKRYDNVTEIPSTASSVYNSITVTSDISGLSSPSAYTPFAVNISSSGFELYIDDQNSYNNSNAVELSFDGGYYTKMVNGSDYSISYTTGVIHFLKEIPESSRIFAVYKRDGGTLDPCAIYPGPGTFSDRIFVFIKYGYSIDEDSDKDFITDSGEDTNLDGKLNLDIYEIRSVYYLGARLIISSDFSLKFYDENQVMQKDDIDKLGRYKLELAKGLISFFTREPYRSFLSDSKASKIYSEKKLTDTYLSTRYLMASEYSVEARTFKLKHGNVIDKSVRIKLNEKEISSSLYSVDYDSGSIFFADPNNPVISSDSRIEIKYEYLPFGTKKENFIGGVRADYDINRSLRVGGTVLLTKDGMSQIVPDVGKESEQTILFEGDASLKLSRKKLADLYNIFAERKKKSIPAEFTAYAEYAKSYTDVNTFGKALVDNMETSDDTVSVSLSEKDWILSSMPGSYSQADRGILNYYFYRNPGSPETLKGESYTPVAVDYSVKPGPFNIAMGHVANDIIEQINQRSLVFDFSSSGTAVSAVTNKLSSGVVDFSGMQYVEVWVKYEGTGSVNLWLDLGTVNEDSDGDGVLDTEDANKNGFIDSEPSSGYSEDRGYEFNPSGGTATTIGSGPGLNSSTLGDGILNSEDLDGNGTLDTAENVYSINLGSVESSPGVWQQKKVYMNWNSISAAQRTIVEQTLSETGSMRFYITKGATTGGRLSVDMIKVVNSRWKSTDLVDDSDKIKVTLVNSINDSDYRNNSFLVMQEGVYSMLYGDDSTDNIGSTSETAIQVEYNISSSDSSASIIRKFSKEMDIRFYKTMNIWLNARSVSSGNEIGFILGSSDNDYVEYRVTPDYPLQWKEIKLKLSDGSAGNVEQYLVTGNPDFKRLKYIKAVIYGSGSAGKIWLDEIYVSEPEKIKGDAQLYEFELKTLAPLFRTDSGTPVFSDIDLHYTFKGHSSRFNTVNKTSSDMKENRHDIFTSVKILPNWDSSINYIRETSSTDSLNEDVSDLKQGDARRDYFILNSNFASPEKGIPAVTFTYTVEKNENLKEVTSESTKYNEDTARIVQTPVLVYRQEFANFLFGSASIKMVLDMAFSSSKINRDPVTGDGTDLSSIVPIEELEKRQDSNAKLEMNYTNNLFYFRPGYNTSSREYVEMQGADTFDSTGVNGDLKGNFHMPFSNNDGSKFIERNNGAGAVLGIKFFNYISPEYSIDIYYKENGFKDFTDDSAEIAGFSRYKDSISNLTTGIKIPFLLNKSRVFQRVKNLQFNYSRSINLDETEVPYEGEGAGIFSERYGISRTLSDLSSPVFNLFSRYPGYYFRRRGNAGAGRDLVYGTLNDDNGIKDISSTNDYNNSLKLTDRFTVDISADMDLFRFFSSGSINQVCERSNIYGIPNQTVVADAGINFEFDLMRIFNFSFFRSNGEGLSYHSSLINLGLNIADSRLITYNINEKKIAPSSGIVFKWDRSSLSFKYEFACRKKQNEEYISTDLVEGDRDYIYLLNMEGNSSFREEDFGHKFSTVYETDVGWLYNFFSGFYKLTGLPVFSVEYKMEKNSYDYLNAVSPEPYDLQMIASGLKMDLHKNVQGGLSGKMALEKFRNRENEGISREVISYEITANVVFIF